MTIFNVRFRGQLQSYSIINMKKILLPLSAFALLLTPLFAEDYDLPKKDPVFNISFPDKWTVTHGDESVNAVTNDDAIALFAQVDDSETLEASIEASIKHLTENGVKIDGATKKDTSGEINGLTLSGLTWDATDEDGPCRVSLTFIQIDEEQVVTLVYWGSEEAAKTYGDDLESILTSMKIVKSDSKEEADEEGDEAEEP